MSFIDANERPDDVEVELVVYKFLKIQNSDLRNVPKQLIKKM